MTNTNDDDFVFHKSRKGQSAIEYLMTYGWMLLVVAIVGGAIFATVQGQCQAAANGFGDSIEVDDFGVSGEEDFQVELRNTDNDPVFVSEVTLEQTVGQEDQTIVVDGAGVAEDWNEGENEDQLRIDVTDTEVITIQDGSVESSEGCNDLSFSVDYDVGALDNQRESGTLTDEHEITEGSE